MTEGIWRQRLPKHDLEVQTATFDSESTSPTADLVKAADALEEGDVTGIVESDNGIYVAKLTSNLDREATDAKKESIVEERKQEQYDSTPGTVEKRYKDNRT